MRFFKLAVVRQPKISTTFPGIRAKRSPGGSNPAQGPKKVGNISGGSGGHSTLKKTMKGQFGGRGPGPNTRLSDRAGSPGLRKDHEGPAGVSAGLERQDRGPCHGIDARNPVPQIDHQGPGAQEDPRSGKSTDFRQTRNKPCGAQGQRTREIRDFRLSQKAPWNGMPPVRWFKKDVRTMNGLSWEKEDGALNRASLVFRPRKSFDRAAGFYAPGFD